MNKFKIRMGAKVTDKVSGFQGIVTGRAEYSTGCRQYCCPFRIKRGRVPRRPLVRRR